jgi:uncharacterized protein YhbP (UPF0306 family)
MTLATIRAVNAGGLPAHVDNLTESRLRTSVLRILAGNTLCALATVGHGPHAHINTAYFCYSQDLDLYFLSHPGSLHGRNLKANPAAAVAVYSSAQTWGGQDSGLQLAGVCAEAADAAEARSADALYAARFAPFTTWKATLGATAAARAYRFYRFATSGLKVIDEREFGPAIFVSASVRP